jgi:hypothetical protein
LIMVYVDKYASVRPHSATPIPLAPEILEAAGFEKGNDFWIYKGWKLWHDGKGFYHINTETFTQFDYLHQIQNYYFAISQEELQIDTTKLPK